MRTTGRLRVSKPGLKKPAAWASLFEGRKRRAGAVPQEEGQSKAAPPRGRYLWVAGAVLALVAGLICGFWVLGAREFADEQLAEIETARAVPDAENAALIYDGLLSDPCVASLVNAHLGNLEEPSVIQRRDEPWRSEDDPELAAWIEDCAPILDKLLQAAQLEACRFPIGIDLLDLNRTERFAPMLQWPYLLSIAINNDLAEGRLDAAVPKWHCLIQMGNHLRQQPFVIDHLLANNTTALALKSLVRFVATDSPSAGCLQKIEAMPFPLTDDWPQHRTRIETIDHLTQLRLKESVSLWDRLKSPFTVYRLKRIISKASSGPIERAGNGYRYNIATARGLRIVIALRRYHTDTGQWPAGLDQIEASLPEGLLTDPVSGAPFLYHRRPDGFQLYSRGWNKIDEKGIWELEGADDWSIWPLPKPQPKPRPAGSGPEETASR